MSISFHMPVKLVIGEGSVCGGAAELAKLGGRCLIVTGRSSAKKSGALDDAVAALKDAGTEYTTFDEVGQNPYLSTCQAAAQMAREIGAEFILGIGGGSPLDAAKAIAVLAANPGIDGPEFYRGGWQNDPLPVAVIGTTSGTGSEVTQYAVITDDLAGGYKKSIASPKIFAALAFGDARYTYGLPYGFTVSTALDAMTHAVEAYFNKMASPLTDLLCIAAIKDTAHILRDIKGKAPKDITPAQREGLYTASIYAGIVIAHNRTSYCHSMGYFLTERHDVPHGMACASLLPHFIRRSAVLKAHRAERLAAEIDMDIKSLCELIIELTDVPKVTLTEDEMAAMAKRLTGSVGFELAYGSFGYDEAVATLSELFGG